MLQWILRIMVIALILGPGIGLSSESPQRRIDGEPIPEENVAPATPPAAESVRADKAAGDTIRRDSQKAEPAPGSVKKSEDLSGKSADPSAGGPGKGGSQPAAPQEVPAEIGTQNEKTAPSGVDSETQQDQPQKGLSDSDIQKSEPGGIEPLYVHSKVGTRGHRTFVCASIHRNIARS
jgi:hypothetical protein